MPHTDSDSARFLLLISMSYTMTLIRYVMRADAEILIYNITHFKSYLHVNFPHSILICYGYHRRSLSKWMIKTWTTLLFQLCFFDSSEIMGSWWSQSGFTNVQQSHWGCSSLKIYPLLHYHDVIMTTMASQITSHRVVYSTVYSDADQRKHQSSASLAFVWDRWIPRTKG